MARPKIYPDAAARQAAYRARTVKLEAAVSPQVGASIAEISEHLEVPKNMLIKSMIRFALTNRDWKKQGLIWGD